MKRLFLTFLILLTTLAYGVPTRLSEIGGGGVGQILYSNNLYEPFVRLTKDL